ncbi:MAG TPA: shikimate dehydrogenase [Gammaproteobacteria bacterium]|nr:shikimate dehydrogenase [Gammaproteobacteria bacterium]
MDKKHMGRYGLFGHPVAHSHSPAIHAAFARQAGFTLNYELLDVTADDFATAINEFFAADGQGSNITLPHKEAAFKLADTVTDRARLAGAVNTLKKQTDGRLLGDNTDGAGLVNDLINNHAITLHGKRLLICGAGGAARGIIGPLLETQPAQLFIANRTPTKAIALADIFQVTGSGYADIEQQTFDLIINATAASLADACPPLPATVLADPTIAYDLVYADTPTPFMRWAQQNGAAQVLDGWGMLVEQAAESFQLWFGYRPDTSQSEWRNTLRYSAIAKYSSFNRT